MRKQIETVQRRCYGRCGGWSEWEVSCGLARPSAQRQNHHLQTRRTGNSAERSRSGKNSYTRIELYLLCVTKALSRSSSVNFISENHAIRRILQYGSCIIIGKNDHTVIIIEKGVNIQHEHRFN